MKTATEYGQFLKLVENLDQPSHKIEKYCALCFKFGTDIHLSDPIAYNKLLNLLCMTQISVPFSYALICNKCDSNTKKVLKFYDKVVIASTVHKQIAYSKHSLRTCKKSLVALEAIRRKQIEESRRMSLEVSDNEVDISDVEEVESKENGEVAAKDIPCLDLVKDEPMEKFSSPSPMGAKDTFTIYKTDPVSPVRNFSKNNNESDETKSYSLTDNTNSTSNNNIELYKDLLKEEFITETGADDSEGSAVDEGDSEAVAEVNEVIIKKEEIANDVIDLDVYDILKTDDKNIDKPINVPNKVRSLDDLILKAPDPNWQPTAKIRRLAQDLFEDASCFFTPDIVDSPVEHSVRDETVTVVDESPSDKFGAKESFTASADLNVCGSVPTMNSHVEWEPIAKKLKSTTDDSIEVSNLVTHNVDNLQEKIVGDVSFPLKIYFIDVTCNAKAKRTLKDCKLSEDTNTNNSCTPVKMPVVVPSVPDNSVEITKKSFEQRKRNSRAGNSKVVLNGADNLSSKNISQTKDLSKDADVIICSSSDSE